MSLYQLVDDRGYPIRGRFGAEGQQNGPLRRRKPRQTVARAGRSTARRAPSQLRDDVEHLLRVCQAQNLLISTDLNVSRIAFETGFGSISRFYEAFKEVSGRTPCQYRLLLNPR